MTRKEVIEARILPDGADDAERHADQHRKRQGEAPDLGGDRDARQDLADGRPVRHVGIAEIALQKPADPLRILHRQRLIEAEILHDLGLFGRVDKACRIEQDIGDVARREAQHQKNDHRYPEQCQEHQAETPHQIGSHVLLPDLRGVARKVTRRR